MTTLALMVLSSAMGLSACGDGGGSSGTTESAPPSSYNEETDVMSYSLTSTGNLLFASITATNGPNVLTITAR